MKSCKTKGKMAKIPPLKKDKLGNIMILFHKDLYRLCIIKDIIKSIGGIHIDFGLKKYFRLKLETKNFKKALDFCNYLFSEHS